jgi:hypothetical protein
MKRFWSFLFRRLDQRRAHVGKPVEREEDPADRILIPPEFWRSLEPTEFRETVRRGHLDALQCLRLWKMLGRTDPCPTALECSVRRDDVMKLVSRLKAERP